MAKKKSKQQPKQPNTADFDNAAPQIEKPTTPVFTTSNQPANTSQDDEHTPATTQVSFFDFITLATTEDIKKFLKLASTTPDGKNLENLWRRAHGEGYEKGRKSLLQSLERKLEEKFGEGVERGKDLGCEEGYNVAKEAFDDIIKVVKARETPKMSTSNISTQTDPPTVTTVSKSAQTNPISILPTSYSTSSTQTSTLCTISNPTMDYSAQTSPWMNENMKNGTFSAEKSSPAKINENSQTQTAIRFPNEPTALCNGPNVQNESPSSKITPNRHSHLFDTSQPIEDKKSVISCAIPESHCHTALYVSPASTTSVTALETALETPGFTQICPKMRKSPVFNQKHLELPESRPVSE